MPMKRVARILLLTLLCAPNLALPVLAAQADRNQPIHIEADAMRYDDVHQTSVFTGNVVVTKGSLVLRAATVDVRQAPDGYQYATAIAAPGQLATFQQQLDTAPGQPTQTMDGAAQRIEYDGKTDVVTLRGQAMLSRLIDGKLADRSQGNVIAYNQITDVFTVEGGAQGATATNPGGRVRVMLTPQPAAPSAPTAPKSPPALKVAPKLGTQP
ncbi:MAG TPA: lipopolysaccharide transport periplasmic protein LptA [Thiomonas arsenitoxydans]|uniref:lipopolysaccharide transport periplasmic protein LptA n=1 Tax=Thiomonas TaxID=32012 RepID=UPI0023867D12|nr:MULTISPECIES: lipopolysaccharide transport periplasmic protein LptA [Thiomonas]MDE2175598.1 lipopolysaccharide transport periplasmic protein LptA [Betaproteobacteria bacterium]HML80252.1 lipopolysaccharide transport periplasmic protein LptA [Thiomonas arsenitoxydans]HOI67049.1 lipopolysaccharide transport periplasmic protein LptA [Thiomonas arsenitoxydans]